MRRTAHGLQLTSADGQWRTADGRYAIGRATATTTCDNPHPERWRDSQGVMRTGYCPGSESHDYLAGWDIRPDPRYPDRHAGESDLFDSLAEAWEYLARTLAS